jgi:CBS domain-containing protein
MKVRDIMTAPVVSTKVDSSVLEAGELMRKSHISGLPVLDDHGHLAGIVTERDFLRPPGDGTKAERPRWFELLGAEPTRLEELAAHCALKIGEVMTRDPVTVVEDTPVLEVVRLMDRRKIKRLPVMRDGQLVGIVSRADLLRALMKTLRKASELSKEEIAFRDRMAELERHAWLHRLKS